MKIQINNNMYFITQTVHIYFSINLITSFTHTPILFCFYEIVKKTNKADKIPYFGYTICYLYINQKDIKFRR